MISPNDLHLSLAPYFKTLKVVLIYFPKQVSFIIIKISVSNLDFHLFILHIYVEFDG